MHVHISKGKPIPNATKIWVTKRGGCLIANNNCNIPTKELNYLLEIIAAQYFFVIAKWKEHFCIDEVKFYC